MNSDKTILVVEDDRFYMRIYDDKLRKEGYAVKLAYNGEEGIALLKELTPNIILLDLIMPTIDGFGVLKALRDDTRLQSIPVLILSNLGQESDVEKAIELGAVDYCVKSQMSMDDVLEKINTHIS